MPLRERSGLDTLDERAVRRLNPNAAFEGGEGDNRKHTSTLREWTYFGLCRSAVVQSSTAASSWLYISYHTPPEHD
jgi:hypothetical protein